MEARRERLPDRGSPTSSSTRTRAYSPYREPHERAIALLREGAGTAFDARCVGALERVLARERGDALAVAV